MPSTSARSGLEAREGRKVIVVVTDGGDTVSNDDCPQGAGSGANGRRRDLPDRGHADHQRRRAQHRRRERARHSWPRAPAGASSCPPSGRNSTRRSPPSSRELRTQYLLGFYPQERPADQGPLPQAGGARARARICGSRRATAIMGKSRAAAGSRTTASSCHPTRQQTAEQKEALGEATTPPPGKSARAPGTDV